MYYRIFNDNFGMIKIGKKLTNAEIGDVFAYKFLLDAGTIDEIMSEDKFNKKICGIKFIGESMTAIDEKMNQIVKGREIEIVGFIEPSEIKILHNAEFALYFKNKRLHNDDDKPAVVCTKGYIEFYRNGQKHRDRGPAYADSSGLKKWYKHDKLHNDNGPAVTDRNGLKEYYINGKKINDYNLFFTKGTKFDKIYDIYATHGMLVNKYNPISIVFPDGIGTLEKFNIIESHLTSRTPNTSPTPQEMQGLKTILSPTLNIAIITDYIKIHDEPNIILLD